MPKNNLLSLRSNCFNDFINSQKETFRNYLISENHIIFDIMQKLGGKAHYVEKTYLIGLITKNKLKNKSGVVYTKPELLNVLNDLIELKALKEIEINKKTYIYSSSRTIKEIYKANTNANLPNSLQSFKLWEDKIKFVQYFANHNNQNDYEFISNCPYNTLFNVSNSKLDLMKSFFNYDVKKEVFTLLSYDCFFLCGYKEKPCFAFYLDLHSPDGPSIRKELKYKLTNIKQSIESLISFSLDNSNKYVNQVKDKYLYITCPKELVQILKLMPLDDNLKFMKLHFIGI